MREIIQRGEIGEVCLRSDAVMTGYWRDPEATRAAFTADADASSSGLTTPAA